MPHNLQKIKSYRLECQLCDAEMVLTILLSPRFIDIAPNCPFCGKALEVAA